MFKQKYKRSKLYSVPELLERDWSRVAITRLMPNENDTRPNPHYKCAGEMKMYFISRVLKIEGSSKKWRKRTIKTAAVVFQDQTK